MKMDLKGMYKHKGLRDKKKDFIGIGGKEDFKDLASQSPILVHSL